MDNICHSIYIVTFLSQDDVIFFWHYGANIHFRRETGGGAPRFGAIATWSWRHKNLILPWRYLYQQLMQHFVALIETQRFRIATHSYAATFSWKITLCETNNIFCSPGNLIWHKMNSIFWKYIKNKDGVTLESFPNFAYVSSYLPLNSFAWKRDCVICSKVQMPGTWLRPF